MAISGTIALYGVNIPVYMRIEAARVQAYDAEPADVGSKPARRTVFFQVIVHQDRATRISDYPGNANRIDVPTISDFNFTYDLDGGNVYAQAYVWLKAKLAADNLATSIADA